MHLNSKLYVIILRWICEYEKKESLEQLRMIWNNVSIYCVLIKNNQSIGINSIKDLKKARKLNEN